MESRFEITREYYPDDKWITVIDGPFAGRTALARRSALFYDQLWSTKLFARLSVGQFRPATDVEILKVKLLGE